MQEERNLGSKTYADIADLYSIIHTEHGKLKVNKQTAKSIFDSVRNDYIEAVIQEGFNQSLWQRDFVKETQTVFRLIFFFFLHVCS